MMNILPLFDRIGCYGCFITNETEAYDALKNIDTLEQNNYNIYILDTVNFNEELFENLSVRRISNKEYKNYLKPSTISSFLIDDESFKNVLNNHFLDIYPMSVEIIPSMNCNFRCQQCSYRFVKEKNDIWYKNKSNINADYHMSLNTIRLIMKKIDNERIRNVLFSGGGEPFINAAVTLEGMKLAKKLNKNIGVYTNGSLVDVNISKEICKIEPLFIRFSIYGFTPSDFNKYTGMKESWYSIVVENIKNFIKIKKESNCKTKIILSFLVHPMLTPNIYNFDMFLKLFTDDELSNVYLIRFTPAVDYVNNEQHDKNYFYNSFEKLQKYNPLAYEKGFMIKLYYHRLNDLYSSKNYDYCYGNGYFSEIAPNGDMFICCEKLLMPSFCIGNILKNSISDIYNGEQRKQLINHLNDIKLSCCSTLCKPHEINKQISEIISINAPDKISRWRKDLLNIYQSKGSYSENLNAFEA